MAILNNGFIDERFLVDVGKGHGWQRKGWYSVDISGTPYILVILVMAKRSPSEWDFFLKVTDQIRENFQMDKEYRLITLIHTCCS